MATTLGPVHSTAKLNTVKPDYNTRYFRLLVYGPSGMGKTYLMGGIVDVPEMCPALFCDSDMGTMSISDRNIEVVPVRTMKDLEDVNSYVRAHPGEYNTVIWDGLTASYNQIVRTRMTDPGRTDKEDPYVPSQRDWMHGTFRMRLLLDMLKTCPVNFLATAMVDLKEDEFTGVPTIRPGLSNKLAREVGGLFDVVGYLSMKTTVNKKIRTLQLEPGGGRGAKNRSTFRLPALLERPHLHILYGRAILGRPLDDLRKEADKLEEAHLASLAAYNNEGDK